MVDTVIREDLDDPLDDDTSLGQQLDQLSIIAKSVIVIQWNLSVVITYGLS